MADKSAKAVTEAPPVREHLANERTFLAWVRTGIALLGFGVLIARMHFLGLPVAGGNRSALLGLAFAVVGLFTLALATWQYDRTRRLIETESYHSPRLLILAFAALVFGLGAAAVAYLLAVLK